MVWYGTVPWCDNLSFGFVAISGSRSSAKGSRLDLPNTPISGHTRHDVGQPADGRRMAVSSTRNCILRFKSRCGACAVHLGTQKVGSLCCAVRFLGPKSGRFQNVVYFCCAVRVLRRVKTYVFLHTIRAPVQNHAVLSCVQATFFHGSDMVQNISFFTVNLCKCVFSVCVAHFWGRSLLCSAGVF